METAEIEVFLALAEELHFTRTAQRLRLPQPRVTRLVATLERRVGGALFERTSRRVRLTPLGASLRDRVKPAYAELLAAVGEACAAARGTEGRLRLGCTITTGGPVVSRLIETFCARYPGCEVTLHEVAMFDPYTALRTGEVDVLVNWLAVDEPDLTTGPMLEYRDRLLAVGRGHRLAGRESVTAEDLGDEEVSSLPLSFPAALGDAFLPPFTPSGRPIRRTQAISNLHEALTYVARGRLVHPTVTSVPLLARLDLVLVPITDMPPLPLGLVWCTAHENARVRAIAGTAKQRAPRQPGTDGTSS